VPGSRWRDGAVRARRAGATYRAEPACAGQRPADGVADRALCRRRMFFSARVRRPLRDGAVGGGHNARAFERTAAGGAKQPGDLRADGHAPGDCRHATACDRDVSLWPSLITHTTSMGEGARLRLATTRTFAI